MMEHSYNYSFFLGANSKTFISFFNELFTDKNITNLNIIKGGPGSGKSSFMKRIADKFIEKGLNVEKIYCSSDPLSFDAVIIRELGLAFADGTAPHVLEPKYPGVLQNYLDFSAFWNRDIIKSHGEDIIKLNDKISDNFTKAFQLLGNACCINETLLKDVESFTDISKIKTRAQKICKRELKKTLGKPKAYKRFLEAITPDGYLTKETFSGHKVYKLSDMYGLSHHFMEVVSSCAHTCGYEYYLCYSPLDENKLQHVIIPSLHLAFISESSNLYSEVQAFRTINIDKYIKDDYLKYNKKQLKTLLQIKSFLIESAVTKINTAKLFHDDLENFYVKAMDFSCVDELFSTF